MVSKLEKLSQAEFEPRSLWALDPYVVEDSPLRYGFAQHVLYLIIQS